MEVVQDKLRQLDTGFKQWVARQSPPVEVAVATATGALQGGIIGGLMGRFTADSMTGTPGLPAELQQTQMAFSGGPLVQARNFAVMTGVNSGLTSAYKRLRGGIEDAQTSFVAGFGSGGCLSLVSGMGGDNPLGSAFTTGMSFGIVQAGMFKVSQAFFQPPTDDVQYLRSKCMLRSLGLEKYEKNFKKGLLTDSTLPLLNESSLRDVNIPPGPRLLILDYIDRNADGMKRD